MLRTAATGVVPRPYLRDDESELIERTARGDSAALAALYRLHGSMVLTLAYRLTGERADAEDVLHDVFVGLPEALRRYEHRGSFGAWLRRVAVRVALMRLRAVRRRREVDIDPELSTEGVARAMDDKRALEMALGRLSPALRSVVVLKVIEGYSHREIAELLHISPAASEARLSRAMTALRVQLRGQL
jgi:RNA polymerase sigma-70 factor (ECF subfamily)